MAASLRVLIALVGLALLAWLSFLSAAPRLPSRCEPAPPAAREQQALHAAPLPAPSAAVRDDSRWLKRIWRQELHKPGTRAATLRSRARS